LVRVSWDLYLVPPEHAENHGDWLESLVVGDVPADREAAAAHARAVIARRPELERFESDADGTIELSAPEDSGLPLQVLLDGRHASVGVAYWDLGDRKNELATLLVDVVSALQEHTGWVACDPQQDRVVAVDELPAAFAEGHGAGVGIAAELIGEQQPRRKRFLGLF
jgi:hypothetical protein